MPKLEPKLIQRELDQGQLWPVYWVYGPEQMKVRELIRRIRAAVPASAPGSGSFSAAFSEDHLDGAQTTAEAVVDSARSPSLGGGTRVVLVRDAQLITGPEALADLFGPRAPAEGCPYVCILVARDLDQRRKFSKLLVEGAAVVPCEEVAESEREAWISYLVKRREGQSDRKLALSAELIARLTTLDPWSLDIMDQELEKLALLELDAPSAEGDRHELLRVGAAGTGPGPGGADEFLDALFTRREGDALRAVGSFADSPEEALPLLGLLAWNVRQLALLLADQAAGTRHHKISPYLAPRFQSWAKHWKPGEVARLQAELAELDFGFKQTPRLPLGLWTKLVVASSG